MADLGTAEPEDGGVPGRQEDGVGEVDGDGGQVEHVGGRELPQQTGVRCLLPETGAVEEVVAAVVEAAEGEGEDDGEQGEGEEAAEPLPLAGCQNPARPHRVHLHKGFIYT